MESSLWILCRQHSKGTQGPNQGFPIQNRCPPREESGFINYPDFSRSCLVHSFAFLLRNPPKFGCATVTESEFLLANKRQQHHSLTYKLGAVPVYLSVPPARYRDTCSHKVYLPWQRSEPVVGCRIFTLRQGSIQTSHNVMQTKTR